jgi:GNAT superfamily N-acetyltransferase
MVIRRLTSEDHAAAVAIAEALPEWFDATARRLSIPTDLKHQDGFVAWHDDTAVGFITLYVAEGRLNIGWLGVRKEHQRRGIGQALLRKAEDRARDLGIREIATCTLGDGVDYPPYEQTRGFYFGNGFRVYQRSKTDNPGCPEEIRIKKEVDQQGASPAGDPATLHSRH